MPERDIPDPTPDDDDDESEDDIDFDAITSAGEKVSEIRDQLKTSFGELDEIIDEGEDLEFEDD
jgi:hypothetical protein